MNQEIKNESKDLNVGWYLVAFIDVLGQQERLREIRGLPDKADPAEVDKFKEQIRSTYGAVLGMRKLFQDLFESFSKRSIDTSQLTLNQKEHFKTLTSNDIKFHHFSDCISIFLSLRDDINILPMRGIYGILAASGLSFITCLALGHPLRGGIDVGLGMELKGSEIYGPALSRTYALENSVAQYPMIVVGDELINYLRLHKNLEGNDIETRAKRITAEKCLNLIALDDDGIPFVDYLGESLKNDMAGKLDPKVISDCYEYVSKKSNEYKETKNSKLAFKYTLLRNYFYAREPVWFGS